MSVELKPYPVFSYDAHARTCAEDDFLGQVKRTVNGAPVSDDQIAMIQKAIDAGLALAPADHVLELACGNGAVSRNFFDACAGYKGIDCSEYLISVAKRHFERLPTHQFLVEDALQYLRDEPKPSQFTKALCYAGFQYFADDQAVEVFELLFRRFDQMERIFIGNMPNKANVESFYRDRVASAEELTDTATAIGVWRTCNIPSDCVELFGVASGISYLALRGYDAD